MPDATLIKQRIDDIRALYAQGKTCNELADLYGLNRSRIAIIVQDLPKHFGEGRKRKVETVRDAADARKQKSQERRDKIVAACKAGQKQAEVALQFGTTQSAVSRLIIEDRSRGDAT